MGENKTLTPSGIVNDGNNGDNYAYTYEVDSTGVITPASLTATITVANKVVDGDNSATITGRALIGVIGDDVVTPNEDGIATFEDASIGNNKEVTASGITIAGTDAGNYSFNGNATGIGNILPVPIIVYVNDSWAGTELWTDPDSTGPATFFGYDSFSTIQAAITAVADGGTVNVAAGTYNESLTVDKDITIIGVGDTTIIQPAQNLNGFDITANGVTIQDLKIVTSNSGTDPNMAIKIEGTDSVTISGTTIETTGNKALGIWIGTSAATNLNILNNVITINGQSTGIYTGNVNPAHNIWTITGNTISAPNAGVNLELYDVNNVTVSGNTFEISGSVNVVYSSEISNVSGLVLENNTFNGNGNIANVTPTIWIESGFTAGDGLTTVSGVTITGNTFNDWVNTAIKIGEVDSSSPYSKVSEVTINQNRFLKANPTSILESYISESVNAESNYWGTAVKATIDDKIVGLVIFEPYYVNEVGGILNTTPPDAVYVDDNYSDGSSGGYYFGYNAFATIQEGIEAVAVGGTMDVAAGIYDELLTINKNGLTLLGVQADIDPRPMNGGRSGEESVIQKIYTIETPALNPIKIEANNVIINGFTISPHYGTGVVSLNKDLVKQDSNSWVGTTIKYNVLTATGNDVVNNCDELIQLKGVTGAAIEYNYGYHTVESESGGNAFSISDSADSVIQFNEAHNSGDYQYEKFGGAIYSYTSSNINVIGNKIVGGGGITIGGSRNTHGSSYRNIGGTVEGNIIEGSDFGLEIFAENVTVSVNNVANVDDFALSIIGVNVAVSGNNLYGSETGILIEDETVIPFVTSGISINENEIYGNTFGLENLAAAEVDATKNWWGHQDGPQHSTNPGADESADSVSNNVLFRPWCTEPTCTDIDNNSPTVEISSTEISPTNASLIPIIITFSENVTDLTADEIDEIIVTNGIITENSFSGSGSIYNLTVTPTEQGTVMVDIAAEVAWDLAGNYNETADQFSIDYDTTAPSGYLVSIDQEYINDNTKTALSFTFADAEVDAIYDYSIGGIVSGSGTIDSADQKIEGINVSSLDDETLTLTITLTDVAGNIGDELTDTVIKDTVAPIVPIITFIAGDNYINDLEKAAIVVTGTAESNALVSATLSDSITTLTTVTQQLSDDATTYSITLDGTSLADGTITPSVTATDMAGNIGSAAVTLTAIKDIVAPAVVSHTPSDNTVGIDPTEDIVITFDEEVDFNSANINISGNISILGNSVTISSISLTDNTKYAVVLTGVTDLAGNAIADYEWSFTTAASYSIELKAGWNLISLPVTPTTWANTSDVLADISGDVDRVWSYDAVSEEWFVYAGNPDTDNLNIMVAGHGYWIKMTGDGTLTGIGTLYEQLIPSGDAPPSQLPEIPLAEGWNLIGYYQLPGQENALIANALSKLNGAWSGSGSDLITFGRGTLETLTPITTMSPGDGYWIFMTDSRKYSFGN